MRPPLRVGLVGLGVISRFYLAALRTVPGLELVAVCDRNPAVLAARPAGVPGYTDHARMLDEAAPDAVVVTAPNDAHARICADALGWGAAVCVEKPLALDSAQAEPLTELARQRGTPLFTAFHRRYNSGVARLREDLAGRRVVEVTVRYLERIEEHAGTDTWYLDPDRCGGGCVADNGPNAFDLVESLLGPVDVVAARVDRDAAGTDRRAEVELRARGARAGGRPPVTGDGRRGGGRGRGPTVGDGPWAGGARARVLLDWSHPGERKDVEVRTDDGTDLRTDMLAGHPGFKGSLWHEYVGVLTEFEWRVREGLVEDPGGPSALKLVGDAYRLAAVEERRTQEGAR
ncbi:putative dehydrogenase [Nocardiopsis arvandica]|uniref:Putative dehydrogenase n=1 Tax=Nocardiopsis sinuspersici TaxID=501010 RepID=A0A7Y9XH77_9ACTN|nr:Gfo/Idh/MocA family oxidoreductase [Nocardiopsis sinuspersici]NYH54657.1 putative dehydrogenase [Nocardiopsis sinuspersici]